MDAVAWRISSSDGSTQVVGRSAGDRNTPTDANATVPFRISIGGKFLDRVALETKSAVGAGWVADFSAVVEQVIVRKDALVELRKAVSDWLDHRTEFEIELSGVSNQSLRMTLGERDDLIYRPDRPALTVSYRGERMKAEWFFVVDQTCLWEIVRNSDRDANREVPMESRKDALIKTER